MRLTPVTAIRFHFSTLEAGIVFGVALDAVKIPVFARLRIVQQTRYERFVVGMPPFRQLAPFRATHRVCAVLLGQHCNAQDLDNLYAVDAS